MVETGTLDKVRFGPGIAAADILFLSMDANALVLRIAGTDDRLTLRNIVPIGGGSPDYGIERFEFADNTAWTREDILSKAAEALAGRHAVHPRHRERPLRGGADHLRLELGEVVDPLRFLGDPRRRDPLHRELDLEDDAGEAHAAERREEEVRVLVA